MKRILFRADAAPNIGIGDLMSFINLSHSFKNWEVYFVVKDYEAATNLIEKYNLKNVYLLDQAISIDDEVDYINFFIKKNNIYSIFLQINENKLSVYDSIDVKFKACAHFDSNLPNNYDLVLSWNYDSKDYFDLKKYKNTKFFLGAEYVVLPVNFNFKEINKRTYKNSNEKLLISMGGVDEKNLTLSVIKNLHKMRSKLNLIIILGSGYEFENMLIDYLKTTNLSYIIKKSINNMYLEYMSCDIAIGTGGLTVSELIATKTPALIVSAYEHQIKRCSYFAQKGWIIHLGYMNTEFTREDLNFVPNDTNRFDTKILEVVEYFDKVCK
jgi:spore coat polysaccharide biosynthesis predicted glycosyltransferase SpsG